MRLHIYRIRFYLISLAIHMLGFFLLTVVSVQEILIPPTFQTAVYFESSSSTINKKTRREQTILQKSRSINIIKDNPTPPTAGSMETVVQKKGPKAGMRNSKLTLPILKTKQNKSIPFLKSADRESRISSSEELEKKFKKKEYHIPYQKKKSANSDSERSNKTVDLGSVQAPAKINDKYEDFIQTEGEKQKTRSIETNIWRKKNDLNIYRNILGKLITSNWIVPPVSVKKFQILIEAFIDPKGDLIKLRLIQSSGLAILDAAAERAIRVSTPFPTYPQSFDQELTSFRAVFRFTPERVGY